MNFLYLIWIFKILLAYNYPRVLTQFTELSLYKTCNNTNVLCWGMQRNGNAYTDCIYGGNCDLMVAMFEDKHIEPKTKTKVPVTTTRKERVRFQLMGKPWDDVTGITHGGYIAVGLSFDQYMGDDSVMECVCTDVKGSMGYRIFGSYNTPGKKNIREKSQSYIQSNWVLAQDGTLFCDFYRDAKTIVNGKSFDLTTNDQKYFILLAMGKLEGIGILHIRFFAEEQSTKLGYHSYDSRLASQEPILYRDKIISHLPPVGPRSSVAKIASYPSIFILKLVIYFICIHLNQ